MWEKNTVPVTSGIHAWYAAIYFSFNRAVRYILFLIFTCGTMFVVFLNSSLYVCSLSCHHSSAPEPWTWPERLFGTNSKEENWTWVHKSSRLNKVELNWLSLAEITIFPSAVTENMTFSDCYTNWRSSPNLNQSAFCRKPNHRQGSGFAVLDFVCPTFMQLLHSS